jgi:hypothetical protein
MLLLFLKLEYKRTSKSRDGDSRASDVRACGMKKLGDRSTAENGCLAMMYIAVALFFIFAFIGFLPGRISRPIKHFLDDWSNFIMGG